MEETSFLILMVSSELSLATFYIVYGKEILVSELIFSPTYNLDYVIIIPLQNLFNRITPWGREFSCNTVNQFLFLVLIDNQIRR